MYCPKVKRNVGPSRCLMCPYFGGFKNSGVLCYKANRWIKYKIIGYDANTRPAS